RAGGRHPAPRRALPHILLEPPSRGGRAGTASFQGRDLGAAGPLLARERARAAERDRARRRAARARRRRAARGHPVHQRQRVRPRAGGGGRYGRRGRELLRGARPAARALRPPLPHARGDPRRRQPLQGGAVGQGRPYDVLPADEPARPAAQPVARIGRRVRASPERDGAFEASSPVAALPPQALSPLALDAPLAGVASAIITAATRRVARRWRDEAAGGGLPAADDEVVAGLLSALALAVDQERPGYVTELLPRPAAGLGQRLVDMLRAELLRAWSAGAPPVSPAAMLGPLNALEQVRQAIDRHEVRQLESHLNGVQGLDLLVEVIHDLRSPLTSILFLAETLQRGQSGGVNPVQHRQLGLIYSAALGLSSIVSDTIELARGGDELADREVTPFSVAELFESIRSARGGDAYCFSGTGLGLAITRKLVRAQGTTLQLETRPGWGTCFFFELDLPAHAATFSGMPVGPHIV